MPLNRYRPAPGAADTTESLAERRPVVLGTSRGMPGASAGVTRIPADGRLGVAQSVLRNVIQSLPTFFGNVNGPANSLPACRWMVSPPTARDSADLSPFPSETVNSAARTIAEANVMAKHRL